MGITARTPTVAPNCLWMKLWKRRGQLQMTVDNYDQATPLPKFSPHFPPGLHQPPLHKTHRKPVERPFFQMTLPTAQRSLFPPAPAPCTRQRLLGGLSAHNNNGGGGRGLVADGTAVGDGQLAAAPAALSRRPAFRPSLGGALRSRPERFAAPPSVGLQWSGRGLRARSTRLLFGPRRPVKPGLKHNSVLCHVLSPPWPPDQVSRPGSRSSRPCQARQ